MPQQKTRIAPAFISSLVPVWLTTLEVDRNARLAGNQRRARPPRGQPCTCLGATRMAKRLTGKSCAKGRYCSRHMFDRTRIDLQDVAAHEDAWRTEVSVPPCLCGSCERWPFRLEAGHYAEGRTSRCGQTRSINRAIMSSQACGVEMPAGASVPQRVEFFRLKPEATSVAAVQQRGTEIEISVPLCLCGS